MGETKKLLTIESIEKEITESNQIIEQIQQQINSLSDLLQRTVGSRNFAQRLKEVYDLPKEPKPEA